MGTTVREEKTTTQQKTEPWAGAQPYYADLYASAEAARKSGAPAPYPGSSVVDWSSQMQDAYRQMEATARNGSTLNLSNSEQQQRLNALAGVAGTSDSIAKNSINAAQNIANIDAQQQTTNNNALLNAGNLSNNASNLWLTAANQLGNQSAAQQASNLNYLNTGADLYKYDTTNRVNAMNTGATLANQDFANQLSNAGLQLNAANGQTAAQNAENGQRLQAAGMTPGLRAQDYADAQALLGVGQASQSREGAYLQDEINKWDKSQNAVWTGLVNQANILNGGGFNQMSGTQTKPIYTNNTAQAMGAVGSIAGLMAK